MNTVPSNAARRKAEKLLTQYSRIATKTRNRSLPRDRIAALDAKRANETITSNDLPGTLRAEFPAELEGLTLKEIRAASYGEQPS